MNDPQSRESREARQRLDDLQAENEMQRFRGRNFGFGWSSCLDGCGGMMALFAIAAAGIIAAVVMW